MQLHSQRVRRAERDAREAAGEDLWTEEVPMEIRLSIAAMWQQIEELEGYSAGIRDGVVRVLRMAGVRADHVTDWDSLTSSVTNDWVLDCIGALCVVLSQGRLKRYSAVVLDKINELFEDYRVSFRIVDGELIPFGSDEMHQEVVIPALRLLVGDRYEAPHRAYLAAIKELPADPSNAITDAGTALQQMLVAQGMSGNALGPLISDAKRKDLFKGHDQKLAKAVEDFMHWVAANRSERGDAHNVTEATREDAWLMVHIVGALIVYLAHVGMKAD